MLVPESPKERRLRRLSPAASAGRRLLVLACAAVLVAVPAVVVAAPAAEDAAAAEPVAEAEAEGAATQAPAKPKAPAPPKGDGQRETDAYAERLDALDGEVNVLKDRIFRSKARLAVLRETVLAAAMAGARVLLAHRNLMGTGFQLTKVTYYLDGAPIFDRRDESGGLDQEDELVVFDGNLAPGQHIVGVELLYKGKGFGTFSYLRGYEFRSHATHEIEVGQRGAMKVVSLGYERGNITTEMGDRPAVDWQTVALDAAGRPVKKAGAAKPAKASTR
jgi:hypothetical protein